MKNLFKGLLSVVVALAMVIGVMPTVEVSATGVVKVNTLDGLMQAVSNSNVTEIVLSGDLDLTDTTALQTYIDQQNTNNSTYKTMGVDLSGKILNLNEKTIITRVKDTPDSGIYLTVYFYGNGAVIKNGSFETVGPKHYALYLGPQMDDATDSNIKVEDVTTDAGISAYATKVELTRVDVTTSNADKYAVWTESSTEDSTLNSNVVINSGSFTTTSTTLPLFNTGDNNGGTGSITVEGGTLVYPNGGLTGSSSNVTFNGGNIVVDNASEFNAAVELNEIENINAIELSSNITLGEKVVITKDVTINGNNHSVTSASDVKKTFEIKNSADSEMEVNFNNIEVINTHHHSDPTQGGRCIDTRNDFITVNINNSSLSTTGTPNTQPITIGGTDTGLTTINLNNSSVNAGTSGYAVISFVKTDLNINNSELQGYSVIYLRDNADNSTVDIVNSSVSYSENVHSGETNAFATVVLQDVDNVSLTVKDSTISAIQAGDQPQSVISIQQSNPNGPGSVEAAIANNTITVTGNSRINLEGTGVFISSSSTPAELEEQVTVADSVRVSDNLRNEVSRFVPEEPKSTVEFVVDGKVWRTYRVTKGADIRMPEVPEKEGYVGEWDHDGENIRTATTITAVYTKVEEPVNNTDLSDYADFQLPVYANSRVTNISTANGAITVDGYMFKANANLDKEDSIWREIIFVNEEDYSMAKAYRKQVTPVYNTWLNKNMTATGNGTYKLDYANYTVTFSNTDINNYVGNTAATKMASGSYLAYMRISDGTDSYLFPLKDIVLSDGSTLALPSGFEVVDTTTRALRYIVK